VIAITRQLRGPLPGESAPAAGPQFLELPVEPDQGLPQAFSFKVGASAYLASIYANIHAGPGDGLQTLYDLSRPSGPPPAAPPGYLVLRIDRTGPDARTLLLRKLVVEPGLVHPAGELAVKIVEATVARGNLNGAGHFGTRILIGVSQRWA
jgi:hypothetical protein